MSRHDTIPTVDARLTVSDSGAPDTRGYGTPGADPAQQQAGYGQPAYPADPNHPQHQQGPVDPNAPYDPNAPEGERGLAGKIAGGTAGYFLGKKANHGFIGTIGGAMLGSFLEDKHKDHKHHGQQGGSSWGGKW